MLPGWKEDIRGITEYDKLPENCRNYIEFVEKELGVPVTMASNGPGRHEMIFRKQASMDKAKRVLAIVTVAIIVICVIITLIFGILYGNTNNQLYKNIWMASAFCMFMLPIILWVMRWIYNLLRGRGVKEEKTED